MPSVPIWDERLIFRDTTQIDRFAVHSTASLRDERAVLLTFWVFFRRLGNVFLTGITAVFPPSTALYELIQSNTLSVIAECFIHFIIAYLSGIVKGFVKKRLSLFI